MNKTNFVLGALTALSLTGCGGGSAPAASPPSKLAPYIGTWEGACTGHAQSALTLSETAGGMDTLTYTFKVKYYSQTGCAGPVVASGTYSANITATYVGSTDGSVIFTPASASVVKKIDHFSLSVPNRTYTVTGSGVTHRTINGEGESCVAFSDGRSICFSDTFLRGATGYSRNFYVSADTLYMVYAAPGESSYTVSGVWTKN